MENTFIANMSAAPILSLSQENNLKSKACLVRYHPYSFIDNDNERCLTRSDLVELLHSNTDKGHCISEQIRDQDYIRPYLDIDIHGHDGIDISSTINHYENLVEKLLHVPYTPEMAWSHVHKKTKKALNSLYMLLCIMS